MPLCLTTLLASCRGNTTPSHGRRSLSRSILLLALMGGLATAPAAAGTLIGEGTLDSPNDLTIILDSSGTELELPRSLDHGWQLDRRGGWQPTRLVTSAGRTAAKYRSCSMRSASPTRCRSTTPSTSGLGTNSTEAASFISFLGATTVNAALGWVDDQTTSHASDLYVHQRGPGMRTPQLHQQHQQQLHLALQRSDRGIPRARRRSRAWHARPPGSRPGSNRLEPPKDQLLEESLRVRRCRWPSEPEVPAESS